MAVSNQIHVMIAGGIKKRLFSLTMLALTIVVGAIQCSAQFYTVSGNQIFDSNGQPYYMHSIGHTACEYSSTCGSHFAKVDIDNMAAWKPNTIRVPTNQDYLLSDSSCYNSTYLNTLDTIVANANNDGMNVIFDLHWNDQGIAGTCATGQQYMADSRSLTFWNIMANHYKSNPRVFFELYNEPHNISWDCWLNGCSPWVGMQQLYDTVRTAGYINPVLIGGLNWAYDLSGVPTHRVVGVDIAYATHPYSNSGKQPTDWPTGFGFLTATDPVVATEFGDTTNCHTGSTTYVTAALNYFDAPGGNANNRMGWSSGATWNNAGNVCSLITDWTGSTPTAYGQPVHDRLASY